MTQLIDTVKQWAKTAGELAYNLRNSKNKLEINIKFGTDWVTNADLAVDQLLKDKIKTAYPEHLILSEELNPEQTTDIADPLWIIDPIDGTHNYALGYNYSAVSISFAQNKQVQLGVVYDFFRGELFYAEKDKGAYLNNERISPSKNTKLSDAHILLGQDCHSVTSDKYLAQINNAISQSRDFRRLGAGALDICMVACGRADAFFETLKPWDIAAARLIAAEAGCLIGHYGSHSDNIPADLDANNFIVAAPGIYDELLSIITLND